MWHISHRKMNNWKYAKCLNWRKFDQFGLAGETYSRQVSIFVKCATLLLNKMHSFRAFFWKGGLCRPSLLRQSYLASREVHWKVSITIYLEQTMCKKSSLSKSWNIRSQRSYNHKMHIPWNIRRSRKSIIQWCQLYSFVLQFFSPYLECSLFFLP